MYLYPASPLPLSQLPTLSSFRHKHSLSLLSPFVSKCEPDKLKTMKQSFVSGALLLFFLFLIPSSHLSARLIANKRGQEEVELNQITDMEDIELMKQLMGVETCDAGDHECLNRRIISEAHLDYIYTQHHKP